MHNSQNNLIFLNYNSFGSEILATVRRRVANIINVDRNLKISAIPKEGRRFLLYLVTVQVPTISIKMGSAKLSNFHY